MHSHDIIRQKITSHTIIDFFAVLHCRPISITNNLASKFIKFTLKPSFLASYLAFLISYFLPKYLYLLCPSSPPTSTSSHSPLYQLSITWSSSYPPQSLLVYPFLPLLRTARAERSLDDLLSVSPSHIIVDNSPPLHFGYSLGFYLAFHGAHNKVNE